MQKVALVTGGGRGIGLGISRKLAEEGYQLAIMGMRGESALQAVLEELSGLGAAPLYCRGDISQSADRAAALAAVKARFGRLDLLVNNAGVAPDVRADILEASEESFERLIRINLQGPYFLTQAAARWMVEQREADPTFKGCIVTVSSVSSTVVSTNRGDYCISKAGLTMMTQLFAARLGAHDIPVFEIQPGIVKSDMTALVQEKYDRLIFEEDLLLLKRWGLPADIGRVVAMLARGDLPYTTGQALHVDGGLTIKQL